ncbi:hypothetical protein MHU86_12539 [Fragilaria crotonensis]|nr:hypothetical protein MHU86_12539 [Fragilaria crotonensis]
MFLTQWRSQTQSGKLLRIALHWFQQAVGTSVSILEDVTSLLPHLESKWITSLREFLASISASMHLDKPGLPVLQRQHDTFLMELVMQSQQFTASEIKRINYCRLYLRATTVADVAIITGDKVEDFTLTGLLPAIHRDIRAPGSNRIIQEKQSGSYGGKLLGCGAPRMGCYINPSGSGSYQSIVTVWPT